MSRVAWFFSGLLIFAGGIAIAAIRWPVWQVQAPADVLFNAVPIVGGANMVAAWLRSNAWPPLLIANLLCGPVMGLFAAVQFASFGLGLLTALLLMGSSGIALALLIATRKVQ